MSDPIWINAGKDASVGTATIAASTDLLTIAGHGLVDGDTVTVDTLTGGAVGVLVANAVYFVRDALTDTFAVSLTQGGPPVPFATDGGAAVYRFAPAYTAREMRRAQRMHLFGGHSHRFGAREGVHPSQHPAISVAGTTWTQHDLTAVVYPGLTSQSGPYVVQQPEESGSLDPADGTNPRLDALDLQIQDDDEDAGGFRRARVVYVAGTPGAVPAAPALTANSLRLGTILVPAGGSPSPSVDSYGLMTVAAGGILPVRADSELPAIGRYEGMGAWHQASDALLFFNGTTVAFEPVASFAGPDVVTFTTSGTFEKANFPWAHRARIRVVGGGGSGGGAPATGASEGAEGGGGGGGETAEVWVSLSSLPSSVAVTIGAGGVAGAAGAAGNAGGTTSFGTVVTANGGSGGAAGTATTTSATVAGGHGGIGGTGGDLHVKGSRGGSGRVVAGTPTKGNTGGASLLSGSASSSVTSSEGLAGQEYGGGSTGAANGANQAARASLAGAAGICLVELH